MKIYFYLLISCLTSSVISGHDRIWNWSFGKMSKACTLKTYKSDDLMLDINCEITKEFCIVSPLLKVYYPPPVSSDFHQLKFIKDLIFAMCKRRNPKMFVYNFNITSTWNLSGSLETMENGENVLENLQISATSLYRMPTNFHCPLKKLKVMNLTANKLSRIEDLGIESHKNCSNALDHMEILDLSENQIQKITKEINFQKLQKLFLQGNKIKEMNSKSFAKLNSLKILDLSANSLHHLPDTLFHNLSNLRDLDLHDNLISHLPDMFSYDLGNVTMLDLSKNLLEEISSLSLRNFTSLEFLSFSCNRIHRLNGKEFENLQKLKFLDLQNNQINSIAIESFGGLKSLKILHIDGNKLVDVGLWEMLKNVKVSLGRNPWSCDCEFIRRMVQVIEENKLHVDDTSQVYCEEKEKNLKSKYLTNPLEVCEDYMEYGGNVIITTTEIYDETTMFDYHDETYNEI